MRLLHVIPTVALAHGGPSFAVRQMARTAASRGLRVEIAATSLGTPQGDADPKRLWVFDDSGIRFRLFPTWPTIRWNVSVPLTRWLFAHARDFDLLHVHAPFSYPTIPACAAARRHGVPYVLRTLGTLDPFCFRNKFWKKWPYFQIIERRHLRQAASIHVTSEMERRAVAKLGFHNLEIIPIGVPEAIPPRRDPSRTPVRVLFIGRLHPIKGLEILMSALASLKADLPKWELLVAGDGPPSYRRKLDDHAARCGIRDRVQFLGFVQGESKSRLLSEADIFALTGYHENYGVAAVEALMSGLPVVLSEGVALAHEVQSAGAGRTARTGDIDDTRNALAFLFDPRERSLAAEAAHELAVSRFSEARMAESLLRLYENLSSASRDHQR